MLSASCIGGVVVTIQKLTCQISEETLCTLVIWPLVVDFLAGLAVSKPCRSHKELLHGLLNSFICSAL
jgi:hypothetical protein